MDAKKIAEENLFFYTVTGSRAYGMATDSSDKDYRGLFYAPKNVYMSLFKNVEQVEEFAGEKDSVIYELSKFIKLLVDQNPNILELLWVDDKFIVQHSQLYKLLRERRDFFLSSKAKHTFSGYAISQLKRIKGHNKWINNPQPKRRPKEVDFVSVVWNGTDNQELNSKVPFFNREAYELGNDIFALVPTQADKYWYDRHEALVTKPLSEASEQTKRAVHFIAKFNRQLYKEAVENWQHYWQWKDNRNEARASLEEKYGYDTKHAAHLVRLLRMGCEILRGEGVKVLRPDAKELLDIRNGAWTYGQLVAYANEREQEMESLYKTTKLPFHIDQEKTDEIAQMIYSLGWNADEASDFKATWNIGYKK